MMDEQPQIISKKEAPAKRPEQTTIISILILGLLALGFLIWWLAPARRPISSGAENAAGKPIPNAVDKATDKESMPGQVTLSPEAIKRAGIETAPIATEFLGQQLTATGRLLLNEDAAVRVGTFVSGRVVRVLVKVGDRIQKGQALVYIHSHELMDARAAETKAAILVSVKEKALALAQAEQDRAERLLEAKAISRREQMQATAATTALRAELDQARAELHRAQEFLEHLPTPPESPDDVAIRATASGVLMKRLVTEGTVVTEASDLMEIANLSTLWAVAEVPEAQATLVRIGQLVTIQVPALGATKISGKVTYIGTVLDATTRAVQVRCLINNTAGTLHPEMYATVQLSTESRVARLAVPREALLEINGQKIVFLALDNHAFEKRVVQVGREQGETIEITQGLDAGQRIVTKGGFFIKTEFLKGSLSEE